MKTLLEFGIECSTSYGNHKTFCPQCRHERKSKNRSDRPLSVTIDGDGAVWNCHNCQWTGSNKQKTNGYHKPVMNKPVTLKKPVKSDDRIKKWFGQRGISEQTMDSLGVFETTWKFDEKEEKAIAFPYFVDGESVNCKYRGNKKKFRQQPNAMRSLYNIDNVKKHWDKKKEIIFVEGEMDVLSLFEVGIENCVTLPDGASANVKFDENDLRFTALKNHDWIWEAEKVVIATDADSAGQGLAKELIHRFGRDVCWLVDWGDCKDANECLQKDRQQVSNKIKNAQPFPVEGLHTVKDYFNDVMNLYNFGQQKALSTGFENLDEIYKIMEGTFHLITGIPNHGKSNFLDQLAVNLMTIHNWKFAVFSPEHSSSMHIRRIVEKLVKQPFEPTLDNNRMSPEDLKIAMNMLQDKLFFIESENEIPTIDWILKKAKQSCVRNGVKGIIIDPYNEIDSSREGNKREDEQIRDLISKCKQFCRSHNVVIFMVAHPNKLQRNNDGSLPVPSLYDVSGSAHWNNMTDCGLVVYRDFNTDTTRVITRKIREQGLYGHIGEAYFKYDMDERVYKNYRN